MTISRLLNANRNLKNSRQLKVSVNVPKYADFVNQAMVSFSYDDGHISNYTYALPLHLQNNIPASFNIITNVIGASAVMDKAQLLKLDERGFEIASHSHTHPLLNAPKMFSELTAAETISELNLSKATLENLGLTRVEGIAIPGSKLASFQIPLLEQYFKYARVWKGRNDDVLAEPETATGTPLIAYPMKDLYDIASFTITNVTQVQTVLDLITQAVAEKKYIIFMMHRLSDGDELGSTYTWDKAKLQTVFTHINSFSKSDLLPINMRDGIRFASGQGDFVAS